MANSYKITEFAVSDLKEIWQYISEFNSESADRTINELTQKFQMLAENQLLGRD